MFKCFDVGPTFVPVAFTWQVYVITLCLKKRHWCCTL